MKIRIEGLDELINKLENNKDLTPVKTVVKKHGASLQSKAIRTAPFDTGTLRRSITTEVVDDGMTAVIEPHTEYAQYVEYGTRFMEAKPYMRPAFAEVSPKFVNDLKKLVE